MSACTRWPHVTHLTSGCSQHSSACVHLLTAGSPPHTGCRQHRYTLREQGQAHGTDLGCAQQHLPPLCMCVCMYVCVMVHMDTCIHACACIWRADHIGCPVQSFLTLLELGLLLSLAAGEPQQPFSPQSHPALGLQVLTAPLFPWVLGSELRHACLHSKCSSLPRLPEQLHDLGLAF